MNNRDSLLEKGWGGKEQFETSEPQVQQGSQLISIALASFQNQSEEAVL